MEKLTTDWIMTTLLACVCGLSMGCSGIGYLVGGAIDGRDYSVESASVISKADSANAGSPSHIRPDPQPIVSLLDRVAAEGGNMQVSAVSSPGLGFVESTGQMQVEIVTRYVSGSYAGKHLRLDSVRVMKPASEGSGRYRLFPDEPVRLKLRYTASTYVAGMVFRVGERSIILRTGESYRAFPLSNVDSLSMSDGFTLGREDLASMSDRLVTVQCLTLNSSPRLFIPLKEVEQMRVRESADWGTWRSLLTTTGAIIDLSVLSLAALAMAVRSP